MQSDTTDKSTLSLNDQVTKALDFLLENPSSSLPENLYQLVIHAVEKPLLQRVLKHVNGNQTTAAKVLGISRATLRKKAKCLGITL